MGLNSLCTSIIYVLNAADLGISSAFVYKLYKPVAEKNIEVVCKLLNFYKKVYTTIGVSIFTIGIIVLFFLDKLIKRDIPIGVNIYLVFLIYLINTSISYILFMYKELVLIANQRKDYVDKIGSFSLLSMYIIQTYFLINKNYYGYITVMPFFTAFTNVMKAEIAKRKFPYYFASGNISKNDVLDFFRDTISVAIYRFRDISRNAFDSIILSAFLGLIVLSNYQNYYNVLVVLILLRSILSNAVAPSLGNCVGIDDKKTVYEVYKIFVYIYVYVSGWFAICYGELIQDFISLWLGKEFILSNTIVLFFVLYFYVLGFCDQTKILREAAGLWNIGRVFAGLEMIANLGLNIILVYFLGMEGILLATIMTIVLINIPFEHYIIFHNFFRFNIKEILRIYLKSFIWFIVSGILTGAICRSIAADYFVLKIIICILVPAFIFIINNYKTKEFKFIVQQFNIKFVK